MLSFLFRVVFDDFNFRVLIEIDDLLLGHADERLGGEVVFVADNIADLAVAQHDAGPKESFLQMLEEGNADVGVELCVHILRDLIDGGERRILFLPLALGSDVVVQISESDNPRVHVNVVALQVEGEAGTVQSLVVL